MYETTLFSHAKLILLGEYAVMHGAKALCLPLKTGQQLRTSPTDEFCIEWIWNYGSQILARFRFDTKSLEVLEVQAGDPTWAQKLIRLIRLQNPQFLIEGAHLEFENFFPPEWGLGSSAATISSVCRLAHVNPFQINYLLTAGSGADIACTTSQKLLIYTKAHVPIIEEHDLPYPFAANTCFVYSGHKQATSTHLQSIAFHHTFSQDWTNDLVESFLNAGDIKTILEVVKLHEKSIARLTGLPSIAEKFAGFNGAVKSLGAWGGDYFMAISTDSFQNVRDYFQSQGYEKVFSWDELVNSDKF